MNKSFFVLCPQGFVNNESFRFYEALMSGAIPVCLKSDFLYWYFPSYWHSIFPNQKLPFIIGKDWKECLYKMRVIMNNPKDLERMNKDCNIFINTVIKDWKNKFQKSILTLNKETSLQNNFEIVNVLAIAKPYRLKNIIKMFFRNLFKKFFKS